MWSRKYLAASKRPNNNNKTISERVCVHKGSKAFEGNYGSDLMAIVSRDKIGCFLP